MKKLSNEVKVGGIAILTIVVFLWLFNFMKGKDLLSSTAIYYTVYDRVGGLAESSPIEVNGYKVGIVQSINFIDATSGRLLVVFSVAKDFKIPRNTVAEIVPVSVLGGMKVQLVYGDGPGFYEFQDTIPGRLAESILDVLENELVPVKEKITALIGEVDSVIHSVNDIMNADFRKDLRGTMSNLNKATGSLGNVVSDKEQELRQALDNLTRFTQMLSASSDNMEATIGNFKSISDTLAASDIYETVANLKATLEKTSVMLGNMNDGKGTAGQLFTNDSLYKNLSSSLESLNLLLKDLKENPKRYVHFSVFGKKDKPSD